MSHRGRTLLIGQRSAHTMPYQVSFCKQMAVKVQAWACLSHRQVLFFLPLWSLHVGGLTSVVILRNPRMKKKHKKRIWSICISWSQMACCILIFLEESVKWFQVKGKTWATACEHDTAGPQDPAGLKMEWMQWLNLERSSEEALPSDEAVSGRVGNLFCRLLTLRPRLHV